jgi:hypothetical protein
MCPAGNDFKLLKNDVPQLSKEPSIEVMINKILDYHKKLS